MLSMDTGKVEGMDTTAGVSIVTGIDRLETVTVEACDAIACASASIESTESSTVCGDLLTASLLSSFVKLSTTT